MPSPLGSLWSALTAKFQTSGNQVNNMTPQSQGPFPATYSSYPHLIGRSATTADRAYGSGRTGGLDIRTGGMWPQGYVAEGTYIPTTHGMAPRDNLNHDTPVPRSIGVGDDGRQTFIQSVPGPHDFTPADWTLTQGRSTSMWSVLEFPGGWRTLVQSQQPARYNLYNSIQLARPVLGADALLGYAIPPGQAAGYPSSAMGRPLGG